MKRILQILALLTVFLFVAAVAPAEDAGSDDEWADSEDWDDGEWEDSEEDEDPFDEEDDSGEEEDGGFGEDSGDASPDGMEDEEDGDQDSGMQAVLDGFGIEYRAEDAGISAAFAKPYSVMRLNNTVIVAPEVTNFGGKTEFVYESSDETIATVNNRGKVHAVGIGRTVIRCTVKTDGAELRVSYLLEVVKAVKKIYSDVRNVSMHSGEELTPVLTYSPADATMQSVVWTTSDEKVAQVSPNGVIHANRVGMCMITGTASDGLGAEVRIRVVVPRVSLSASEVRIDDPSGAEFSYWVNAQSRSVSLITGCYEQAVKASSSTRETREKVTDLPVEEVEETVIRLTPVAVGQDKYFVTANGHDYVVKIAVSRSAIYLPVKCGGLGSRVKENGLRYELTGTVVSVTGDGVRTLILEGKGEDEQYAVCTVPADVVMDGKGEPGEEVRIDGILQGRTQYTDENRHYHWAPNITVEQILSNERTLDPDTDDVEDENQDDSDADWDSDGSDGDMEEEDDSGEEWI